MNICTFNEQQFQADGTRNTATTPSRERWLPPFLDTAFKCRQQEIKKSLSYSQPFVVRQDFLKRFIFSQCASGDKEHNKKLLNTLCQAIHQELKR